uniref:Uncharacterized protein n=1 Tax=Arundo donax TaxID=35708 RepID=A0A0A9ABM3_ARUDO
MRARRASHWWMSVNGAPSCLDVLGFSTFPFSGVGWEVVVTAQPGIC